MGKPLVLLEKSGAKTLNCHGQYVLLCMGLFEKWDLLKELLA